MNIGDKIKCRRMELGLSVDDIAHLIGKNRATIYRYESSEIESLPITVLEPLARALHTTPAYLMGWEENSNDYLSKVVPNVIPMPKTKKVPLIGTIACGEPILAEENIEDYVDMPENLNGTFALKCKGDSMINARILDGDTVYIREQPEVDNGQIAAVLIDGEATLKRVYYYPQKSMLILKPENPIYEDFVYVGEELNSIRIMGKAVGFISRVR